VVAVGLNKNLVTLAVGGAIVVLALVINARFVKRFGETG
jgi:hypothetical protein